MDIVEELITDLKGTYSKDDLKKMHTSSGEYISQNSYGEVKKKDYNIKIYCYSNKGIRAVNTLEGSPFKILLILPFMSKARIEIFPKSLFQKILGNSIPMRNFSAKGKQLLKKYSLKNDKQLSNYILNDTILPELISNHIIYISTKIQEGMTVLTLRPNESVITKEDLNVLYDIMDRIGSIISNNKIVLRK